ncbi:unnamed protein product, partial [Gulo gulo]
MLTPIFPINRLLLQPVYWSRKQYNLQLKPFTKMTIFSRRNQLK